MSVLGYVLSQIKCRRPLPSQHWCHASEALRVARIRRWGSKNQGRRTKERLWRGWWSPAPPRATLCSRNHQNRAHQLSLQWSSCRTFRYWQNKRVGQPEILLAEPEERHRKPCARMWRLSGFKNRLPQALWRPAVFAYTDASIKRPLHELCDRLIVVRGLERWQLWLDPHYYRPIDQDGALRASQSHYWCFKTSGSHHRRYSLASRPTKLNRNR